MRFMVCMLLLMLGRSAIAQVCLPLEEYDTIVSKVTERFYDRTFRGLDWTSRVNHYRERLDCSGDKQAVSTAVNELLAELKASHTALYTAEDLEYWALQSIFSRNLNDFELAYSGIWPEHRNGAWYAKYVLTGSPAEAAGVSAGDQLIGVDSKEFHPLALSDGLISTLVICSDGKKTRQLRITPSKKSIQAFFIDASQRSRKTIPIGAKNVGYFHLWAGTHELFLQSMNSALSDFEEKHVDGLILDLRGGFGGASVDYLQKLKDSQYLNTIPKIVLIDDGVRSGKELLAATIKHEHIATLVGSKTAGAFLGASPVRLFDNKYLLYIAVSEWSPPEIGPIEGVGVEPDIAVSPCTMFCSGQDSQLAAAIKLFRERFVPSRTS